MKFGVVVFPGSNCDQDCFHVVDKVLKQPVEFIWHKTTKLDDYDCLIIPGGFSYGDSLRCGAIARFSPIMEAVIGFANKGGLVIGICNGFQVLLEAGLLPGAMLRNKDLHFICKFVDLKVETTETPFSSQYKKGQVVSIPIAHNEGNYYIDDQGLAELKKNNQIVFTYTNNPNGAVADIAGIVNKNRNILGMMPHPERCSEDALGGSDGRIIWESIVKWLNQKSIKS
ncbi:phosphoribosylformylglycinamidine synthase I [candidate division WOR-1 bacterium RIFOXYB2_FULL_42_35]|uniref:Phosphoribosylformylglycinamidine synthase subunit PurQ n=1 Tax=candidate division WOR-1 bacterium RIFOXYC2_FULL_41_25 TaxID=1802586 RepID=A0A1F4TNA5_UNCSA|nr:MAG: phosphoribosylformylglycinamidine synthase I [candidate division WOR-1 bacterium RIFOXYA2_FULL_41_14]OGC24308.1 MAG: phosphoribosylformylglycinamidine synthase I [candidate division WOR-1 bacterium RIFOXYB2_FULL_42_35]OGC34010.1 MAG: phosphoribosylformylglycinamidine synthase I [candidate division WOR-1 bacterium RIFOXYC2_FULL_41_25]